MRHLAWLAAGLAGLVGAAAFGGTAGASALAQGWDPRAHRTFAGPSSQVLVLGTPHLSGLPDTFRPEQLAPLLDRLAAWQPQIITIEALSGPQCDHLRRYAALHANAAEDYCPDVAAEQKALGLDMAGATIAVETMLKGWPAHPDAAQRRRLAALFLASGDPASAYVQWLRLTPAERRTGDGLDAAMVTRLEKAGARQNENVLIAATLAARLGLERVYPTDDHSADDDASDDPAFGPAVNGAWQNAATEQRKASAAALEAKLGTTDGLLALYRYHNDPSTAQIAFDSDWGAALKEPSAGRFGRRYVGWWETRNLRMVANIRAVLQRQPGARLLTIVGSSHKPYFDAYLRMLHDVQVVDTAALLHKR
ncbi:hypothetical protein SAMN05428950_1011015 [Sphingomonas sp. OV641]|uniref:DUF5694 domain-containing protein n=1 Tax=Sphingomonas sp. OV641 TaxID=1881068 RepID=UPI0008BB4083|nr:DUF5694 domain-containing protein [Sphingomonas sp. OV641]SEJ06561.1 hypothetical protein SAMN05428950_1011015 [Sphingomonas sp. OV641]